jgi:DNA-binding MarR family transcriptional regulator
MGQRLMIHPTSVTNIVDRLAEHGLIERVPHPTDRRATLARITPAGRALMTEATAEVNAIRFGVGTLADDGMEEVVRLVRALRLSTGDFVAD